MPSLSILTVLVWIPVPIVAAAAILAWRQRPRAGATAFAVTMLATFWWISTAALGHMTTNPTVSIFLSKIGWFGVVFVPVGWLLFTLEYTGQSEYVTFKNEILLLLIPTITLTLSLTNSFHGLLFAVDSYRFITIGQLSVLKLTTGPWFWVHSAYSYLLLIAGIVLIVQLGLESQNLYRGQLFALLSMAASPILVNVASMLGLSPIQNLDLTPVSFAITGIAGVVALTQYQFLDAKPVSTRVAQNTIVDSMDAGVIVTDLNGRVVDLNPTASEILSVSAVDVLGTAASEFVPKYVELVDSPEGDRETISIETDGLTRYYEMQVTPIRERTDHVTGHVAVFYDVTSQRNRLQRIDVLNRVLRHNLRNEMNVIYGYADQLDSGVGSNGPTELGEQIKEKAMSMVELADTARTIDTVIQRTYEPPTPQTLETICGWVCDRLDDEYPAASIECELSDTLVYCDQTIEPVVKNIVDNAIEHNDAASPSVSITATADAETVTIRIADDGPGLPENERTAITSGAETALDHASGLGLWLANWGVQSLGGTLSIEDNDPEGTVVVITVPRLDPEETEQP